MRTKLTAAAAIVLILIVGAWVFYPTSTAQVRVVGSLSPAAVEDIVDIIKSEKRSSVNKALFSGQFREAWFRFREAWFENVEAIYENENGSVRVVSARRYPDQSVRRYTNGIGGWTGNWPGTRARTNATEH